jgi:hypothetical protein
VSAAGSHCQSWRSGHRFGERRLWLRSSYLDTQEHLPYMDDSRVVSPEGSLDSATAGGLLGYYTAALGSHSRQNSYSSHTSRVTYNSHAELTHRQGSRELHWMKSGPDRTALSAGWPASPPPHTSLAFPSNGGGYNGHNGGLRPPAGQPPPDIKRSSVHFPVRLTH